MKSEMKNTLQAQTRSEKTSALLALFGAEFVGRLEKRHPGLMSGVEDSGAANQTRVAWQKNRLLEKFRPDSALPAPKSCSQQDDAHLNRERDASSKRSGEPSKIDNYIASGLSLSDLPHEHPAIIARVLRGLDREARVSILQQLPGKTARAALRRLSSP